MAELELTKWRTVAKEIIFAQVRIGDFWPNVAIVKDGETYQACILAKTITGSLGSFPLNDKTDNLYTALEDAAKHLAKESTAKSIGDDYVAMLEKDNFQIKVPEEYREEA
jgi:hypothetical protein